MAPNRDKDKDKERKAARDECEVAHYTKELGPPLQRRLLQLRLSEFNDSGIAAASHGDEAKLEDQIPLPREDRAG
jgi:hypothetical protein